MSDLGSYLPLSRRSGEDESRVTGNWASHFGRVVLQLADALDELPASALDRPSLKNTDSVGTIARRLVLKVETPAHRRMAALIMRAPQPIDFDRGELISRLRAIAVSALAPRARRGIRDLTEVVVTSCDLAASTGAVIPVDPIASGAVAVARAATAPAGIRVVLSARTLEATDAGWKVGRGPAIRGSAAAIVLFLFGRTVLPADAEGERTD